MNDQNCERLIDEVMRLFPQDMEPLFHTTHCYGCDCVMLALANHIRDLDSKLASERELRREAEARADAAESRRNAIPEDW